MDRRAFQDQLTFNYCWGCGMMNPHGLHFKSFWDDGEAVCRWSPQPDHMAGPQHVLNGGIIATVMDCHCVCTAVAAAYRSAGRPIGSEPLIWYVTAVLEVSYSKPTPIDRPVEVRARITEATDRKTILACSLNSEGEERARGRLVAVRVPPDWLETR